MYCEKCGTQNSDSSKFCSRCGKPVSRAANSKSSMRTDLKFLIRALLGGCVWVICFVIIAIVASSFDLPEKIAQYVVVGAVFVAAIPALLIIRPWKIPGSSNSANASNAPAPIAPFRKSAQSDQANQSKASSEIIAALHAQTVQDLSASEDEQIEPEAKSTIAAKHADKVYHVTGIQHYISNLLNLAFDNSDYSMDKKEIVDNFLTDERIYQYKFYPTKVELSPEPDNPYDPNAIKVIIDDEHIGYIKKGSCKHLLKVISEGRISGIDCDIGGGPYKYVYESEDEYGKYELENSNSNYFVTLCIRESQK